MMRTVVWGWMTCGWICFVYWGHHIGVSLTREEAISKMSAAALALSLHWLWSKT